MNIVRLIGIVLIVAGAIGLVYGGFSFTREKTVVKVGSVELNAKEKESFDVPVWAGIAAVVVGGVLLVAGGKKA
ncbi:hypothetical protein BH09PSE6_BH09PSE6_35550 [soil metagenome]